MIMWVAMKYLVLSLITFFSISSWANVLCIDADPILGTKCATVKIRADLSQLEQDRVSQLRKLLLDRLNLKDERLLILDYCDTQTETCFAFYENFYDSGRFQSFRFSYIDSDGKLSVENFKKLKSFSYPN
jgi:hypothetical protein